MLTAINTEGIKVSADKADKKEKYFCPTCGAEMILKQGSKISWHFAHPSECKDNWHYEEKTPWHKNWQDKFSIENQEVVMSTDEEIHRADVFINNTVVEFQHSNLSLEEFNKRNNFYTSLGYRVVWVFDICEDYANKKLVLGKSKEFADYLGKWKGKWSEIFFNGDKKNNQIEIYLQLFEEAPDKNQVTLLIKIKYAYNSKILRLDYNSCCDDEMFVDKIINTEKSLPLFTNEDLYEPLLNVNTIGHATYYYGCPKSKSQYCFFEYGERDKEYISNCYNCNHTFEKNEKYYCTYRCTNFTLEENVEITKIVRNRLGQISSIEIEQNGEIKQVAFDAASPHSLLYWCKILKPHTATFKNVKTGWYVRLNSFHLNQLLNNKGCKGYLSKDKYEFPKNEVNIFGAFDEDWIYIYPLDL